MRYPKSSNYVLLDEVCHNFVGDFTKWYGLRPLGGMLYSYKDPYIPIGRQIDWPYQVELPSVEGLWGDHAL